MNNTTPALRNVLRMNGATWINLGIATTATQRIIETLTDRAGLRLNALELNVLMVLFDCDGMKASDLARAVGRAATSFTPNLDKLQSRGFIERRADAGGDRRAVNIFLTPLARERQTEIQSVFRQAEDQTRQAVDVNETEWAAYQKVISAIQKIDID